MIDIEIPVGWIWLLRWMLFLGPLFALMFLGTLFVFLVAHNPAIYLARWTAEHRLLPLRASLLAVGYGILAFAVLPSVVLTAMGGAWHLESLSIGRRLIGLPLVGLCVVMGLSAVQMFVVHGEGTPIPLDNTKQLVRTGIYAYLVNPRMINSNSRADGQSRLRSSFMKAGISCHSKLGRFTAGLTRDLGVKSWSKFPRQVAGFGSSLNPMVLAQDKTAS